MSTSRKRYYPTMFKKDISDKKSRLEYPNGLAIMDKISILYLGVQYHCRVHNPDNKDHLNMTSSKRHRTSWFDYGIKNDTKPLLI